MIRACIASGFGDLDRLLRSDRELRNRDVERQLDPELVQHTLRARSHGRRVDESRTRRLVAEGDVGRHRKLRHERELLVDHADAQALRLLRGDDLDRRAVDEELALVGLQGAGKNLHQGRLAGAVLADQHEHLTGV